MLNKDHLLLQIKEEIINLKESPLYNFRIKNKNFPVIGEGNHNTKIMFIGEAPGKNEAETGRPFCGRSGKILTELIESIGLKREDVYITNVVKDRPPENRDPTDKEIKIYGQFLDKQIEIIKPKVIATLGRYSMAYIMNKFGLEAELKSISQIHGKIFESKNGLKIISLYHPAVALYQNKLKSEMFKDFKIIKNYLAEPNEN